MLKISDLECGYDDGFILKGINLSIKPDKMVGVIGPNGSGKTTLLRAISRVLPIKNGSIKFNRRDINSLSQKEIARNIAVAGNDTEIHFDISVEDFVSLGRIPHQKAFQFFESKKDHHIVSNALEMTGMLKFRKRSINKLSAGEKQMVIIAKALAQKPKLLLLDEPIVHLDISHQKYILDLIKRLNRRNKLNIIVVLHELNLAAEYCDHLVLMHQGTVYKTGTPEQVLEKETIKQIYKTDIQIKENPFSNKPFVFIIADRQG
jgi:iron complex transport system ATP-binding protein